MTREVKLDPLMKEQALTIVLARWGHCVLRKLFDDIRSFDEVVELIVYYFISYRSIQ